MDLAAGVAHELGNPLNSITIHLQVLQRLLAREFSESSNFEKSTKSLSSCLKEVKRLDSIIVHFLNSGCSSFSKTTIFIMSLYAGKYQICYRKEQSAQI